MNEDSAREHDKITQTADIVSTSGILAALGEAGSPGRALRMLIAPGLAVPNDTDRTEAGPQALGLALGDLAARLMSLPLVDGYGLSMCVTFQPIVPANLIGPAEEIAECLVVDTVAAVLLPGVPPTREHVMSSVHYSAHGRTPGGLNVRVFTRVEPTADEARETLAGRPAFAELATREGHGCTIVPGGKFDGPSLVVAECACGDYRSGATTELEALKSWRRHAAAKVIVAPEEAAPDAAERERQRGLGGA